MSEPSTRHCSNCGAAATGRFCSACGAAPGAPSCASCGKRLEAGAKFCNNCGAAQGAAVPPGRPVATPRQGMPTNMILLWLVGAAVLAALVWLAGGRTPAPAADSGGGGTTVAGGAPDISQMTPRERFTRLADRVQAASENNDQAQFQQFLPMLESSWDLLLPGDRDADARFHFGLIESEAGKTTQALAQADTIMAEVPDHLFGWYLRATIAERANQPDEVRRARQGFLKAYDAQVATNLPEYAAHQALLTDFRQQAGTTP